MVKVGSKVYLADSNLRKHLGEGPFKIIEIEDNWLYIENYFLPLHENEILFDLLTNWQQEGF